MNSLAAVVLLVAVAYANAGAIIAGPAGVVAAPGLGVVSARGAIEGAIGGHWIPDAAAPAAVVAAPTAYAAGHFGLTAPFVAPAVSRGAVEGALGGQWIPDVLGR